jgi:hypothetical protein
MSVRRWSTALGFAVVCLAGLEAHAQSLPTVPGKSLPEVSEARPDGDPAVVQTSQEVEPAATPLDELAWMVGDWVDQDEQGMVEASVAWTKNGTFLRRMFRVTPREGDTHSGMQLIGWDPAEQTIRSWTYDENGGFGEETWRRVGDRWAIRSQYTLPDGGRGSALHVMRKLSDDAFTWKSVNRLIDGAPQADVDEVTVVRAPATAEGEASAPAAASETTAPPQPESTPAAAPTSETPK